MPIPVCVCVYVRVCVRARWGSAVPHINRPFSGQQRGVLQLAAALASYWTQQWLAREAQGSVLSPSPLACGSQVPAVTYTPDLLALSQKSPRRPARA